MQPSLGWHHDKTECIAWEEHHDGRPFAWIEDELTPSEIHKLDDEGFLDAYLHTDIFEDSQALVKAHQELMNRWADIA